MQGRHKRASTRFPLTHLHTRTTTPLHQPFQFLHVTVSLGVGLQRLLQKKYEKLCNNDTSARVSQTNPCCTEVNWWESVTQLHHGGEKKAPKKKQDGVRLICNPDVQTNLVLFMCMCHMPLLPSDTMKLWEISILQMTNTPNNTGCSNANPLWKRQKIRENNHKHGKNKHGKITETDGTDLTSFWKQTIFSS